MRFALDQHGDVMAVGFDAHGFREGDGAGVMRGLFEHGSEAEELAGHGLGDQHFLLIFIDGGDADLARYQYVRAAARVAAFIDALARGEMLNVHLGGEHRQFVVIEQSEQGNVFQELGVARHRSPLPNPTMTYWFSNGMSLGGAGRVERYAWMSVSSASETTFAVKGGMLAAGWRT